MRGTCYGGVIYLPSHPDADLHGLVRACMRISGGWVALFTKIDMLGIRRTTGRMSNSQIWQVSESQAEKAATERHYGQLLICPLVKQYLAAENYRPMAKIQKPAEIHAGIVPKEF